MPAGKDSDVTPETLRVAGGWVRDKLLEGGILARSKGRKMRTPFFRVSNTTLPGTSPSPSTSYIDIDIALSSMSGLEFATSLTSYLKANTTAYPARSVGVVKANPAQSKHLETATTKVGPFMLDFVNLRTDDYTSLSNESSRIPSVALGSVTEDAHRRDLTVNSLYYNLNTNEVEDFTGEGVSDLANGRIRTPLCPMTTLLDDPLRVLRTTRFAARFGFEVDSELTAACKDGRVKDALKCKVSRDRIGAEISNMLKPKVSKGGLDGRGLANDSVMGMRLLHEFGLFGTVFGEIEGQEDGKVEVVHRESLELITEVANNFVSPGTMALSVVGNGKIRYGQLVAISSQATQYSH